jgi:hypothetical protein
MASDDEPKTAYELILERLRKKDREAGVDERPLTDEQRTEILELRKVYEARLAEREILFESARRKAMDPESLEQLEQEYRRDRERIAGERDRKIEGVRKASASGA